MQIVSDLHLPGLPVGDGDPDVQFRRGKVQRFPAVRGKRSEWLRATPSATYLFYTDSAFLIRDGREVVIDASAEADPNLLRFIIAGPVLATILHQRGYLILHASAVAHNGTAVAFIGASGRGKSTTAAVLSRRGYRVLADDVVAVDLSAGSPKLMLGPPRVKIDLEVAVALGVNPAVLSRLHPQLESYALDDPATQGIESPPTLSVVCEVRSSDTLSLQDLQPHEGVTAILANSYITYPLLQQSGTIASHFINCVELVNHVQMKRLARGNSLARLSEVAELLEQGLI